MENIKRFSDIGEDARYWIENLSENYKFDTGLGIVSTTLNNEDHEQLKKQVQTWQTRFTDRLKSDTIVVTPQTDLSIENLLKGPTSYLEIPDVEEHEDVLRDLHEACAGILIGSTTSSEFMSLRAVEGILRKWYSSEVDDKSNYRGWAAAIDDIANSDEGKGPKELRLLDYLRERRNEVAHPDRHSSKRDAENTFRQSIDVVETLAWELENKE